MFRITFHVHSQYSPDSILSLKKIEQICLKKGIDVAILADHNNLADRKPVEKFTKVKIIPGEEINTKEGEVIGIFIEEKTPPGLTPEETIRQIKGQGGLVVIPHPFDRFRRKVLNQQSLIRNIKDIDIIEVFTARNILNKDNQKALELAKKYGKVKIIGSDAHLTSELGNTYMEFEPFDSPRDFLEKLKEAKFYTQKASLFVHPLSKIIKVLKRNQYF